MSCALIRAGLLGDGLVKDELTLFVTTFTTLLAIINPFEVLPVFLKLLQGKDAAEHRRVARDSCLYATALSLFFLVFGTLLLRLFGVPLSMIRIAGGIVLMRIGFDLFSPTGQGVGGAENAEADSNIAFMPLAMPLMFGPGAIATILGMTASVRSSAHEMISFAAIIAAILATMTVTFLCLIFAGSLARRLGAMGIDAVTRIVGFFVSAMGVSLIFHGIIEALQTHGLTMLH
jgi:multiple antibiotic resistance protein